jgi:hypothetical protein
VTIKSAAARTSRRTMRLSGLLWLVSRAYHGRREGTIPPP